MPLTSQSIEKNIKELMAANKRKSKKRPKKQIIAIAYSAARKAGAKLSKKK